VQAAIEASDLRQRYEQGAVDTDAFLDELYDLLRCDESSLPRGALRAFWGDIFGETPEMHRALENLRRHGVRLILLSNTSELHFERIKRAYPALIALFDALVLSYEVGATKPDRAIFAAALDAARRLAPDLQPADVGYVDDVAEYVHVAESLGMRGCVYRSLPEFTQWLGAQGLCPT
jgi:FMN phosphatase YigB (HAD superfamily)